MTEATLTPRPAGCPACVAAPAADGVAAAALSGAQGRHEVFLALPGIHCAGCISAVERGLAQVPGVRAARVNLTLRRVAINAPGVPAERLVAALDALGYEAHELDAGTIAAVQTDATGRDLLMRIAVSGFAMMNVMLLSVAVWSGAEAATRDLFHWISGAIALPAILFSARPFFVNALSALRVWRLNMDVPISLAIILAALMSLYETALSGRHAYFDAALSLTCLLLIGRYLDHRTRAVARSAAQELAALEVPRALRLGDDGQASPVPIAQIAVGDRVLVQPGARMPVDGIVEGGTSEVDRALVTGESLPAHAGPGTALAAGVVNLTGPLTVRVTAAGADSSLHRMAGLVAMAESSRNRYTSLADRAAQAYAPGVHLLALGAFAFWLWYSGGDLRLAINIAVAVLIITCPCALGIAVPAVTTAASGRLFRQGLLIKDGTALERLAEVDTVVLDKTGTLTLGLPQPAGLSHHSPETRAVALALAEGSAHPLASALARALRAEGVVPASIGAVREVPGYGVEGTLPDGRQARFGRAAWLGAQEGAQTAAHLRIGQEAPVAFTFTDSLRPGAAEAVAALKAQGLRLMLLSGDAEAPVAEMAARLGIDEWQAGALPEGKAATVQALAEGGARVLMVGDGLNDTAALAVAHASVSPASALDAARVASDIVLLGQSIAPLGPAVKTARSATRRIHENFVISLVYNVVAVPIALLGLTTPLIAALAMSASSITVSLNALRVR